MPIRPPRPAARARAAMLLSVLATAACASDGASARRGPQSNRTPTTPRGITVPRSTPASSVATVTIADTERRALELRVDEVVTLRDDDGLAGLSAPMVIARTRRGHYLVVPFQRQHAVLVFDSAGRFLRELGRKGGGPDEFASITAIRAARADSIAILDAGNARLAILDPGLAPVRTTLLGAVGGWFGMLDDGRTLLMTGFGSRRLSPADRLWLFDPQMRPVRSFMQVPASAPGVAEADLLRRMAVSGDGTIALAHNRSYTIEIWDVSGAHLRTLKRTPAWFRPEPPDRSASGRDPPRPLLETPHLDAEGRLWVVAHVADPEWEQSLVLERDANGRERWRAASGRSAGYRDTVVEVLDPERGALLASLRLDEQVRFISDDGYVAAYRERADGLPYIDVWQLRLVEEASR